MLNILCTVYVNIWCGSGFAGAISFVQEIEKKKKKKKKGAAHDGIMKRSSFSIQLCNSPIKIYTTEHGVFIYSWNNRLLSGFIWKGILE